MAENSIILRPVSDLFINAEANAKYNFYPPETQSAYLLINEEVMDGESTYIDVQRVTTNEDNVTFGFGFDFSSIPKNSVINALEISAALDYGSSTVHEVNISINIAGVDYDVPTLSPNTGGFDIGARAHIVTDDTIAVINEYITSYEELPPMYVSVALQPADTVTKDGVAIKFSQLYLTVTYEEATGLDIHHKVNGQWLRAQAAYQKQGGVWVEITEDECKEILQRSLIQKEG